MPSHRRGISSFLEAYLPTVAMGVGMVLVLIPLVTYFLFASVAAGDLFGHLGVVSPFIATMIYGGYWLERSSVSTHRWPRIGGWFFGGLLAFLALNVVMMALWGSGPLYNFLWGVFAADVGGAAGLVIGIFEARAIGQELSAARNQIRREEADHRSRQLENFAKIVSHDLRNPLNVAWGRLRLAQEECDSSHLTTVEDAIARMDQIIEDVLMLTWSGQGLDPEDIDVHHLGDVAEASWGNVDTDEARLRVENDPAVRAHERRLQRLLENLFRNAVEHGGEDVSVRIGGLPEGFFVEDDGPGIPPEKREKVFQAGYSSNEEGTGLGLSIVRSIAETHGWDVSATEGREGGVRFEFVGRNGQEG